MNTRVGWAIIAILTVVIAVLAVFLVVTPAPKQASDTLAPEDAAQPFVSENVKISSPVRNASVAKTFTVVGEARGTWYFEASFPVQVRDPDNNLVGQGIAQATENWMTNEFVPFTAPITVENYSGPATLVLMKDNPSGLPENEDSVEFPIVVK